MNWEKFEFEKDSQARGKRKLSDRNVSFFSVSFLSV